MAQTRLQSNNKHTGGNCGHSNRYVFSGKIKCAKCGGRFVGRFKYMADGSKIRRWCCGTAVRQGTKGCDIGKLIRDDDARNMLKTAIRSLLMDRKSIIVNVTNLAIHAMREDLHLNADSSAHFRLEIERVQEKRKAVLDSYFSGDITKDDMQEMKQHYDRQIHAMLERLKKSEALAMEGNDVSQLRETLQTEISLILSGKKDSDVFSKTLLDSMTVFEDRHIELRLKELSQVFYFDE
jgi:hypothetical protein